MRILLLTFWIMTTSLICAQSDSTAQIVLKNGKVITGKILVQKPHEVVILSISKDSSVAIVWEDIKEINKWKKVNILNETTENERMPKRKLPIYYKEKGPYFDYISSVGFGNTYRGFALFSLHADFLWGYTFNRYLSVGAGFGHHYYPDVAFIGPLMMEIRSNFLQKRMSPFLYVRGGYAALSNPTVVHTAFKAKQFLNMGIGYQENTARKFAWTYSVGLQKQWTYLKMTNTIRQVNPITGQMTSFTYEIDGDVILNKIVWNWGIVF